MSNDPVIEALIQRIDWLQATVNELVAQDTASAGSSGPPSGSAGGDLSGTYPNPSVAKIQGRLVYNTAPTNLQALVWDAANNRWTPGSPGAGGTASGDLSGTYPSPTVAKLQGRNVFNGAPSDGDMLIWDAANSRWAPMSGTYAKMNVSNPGNMVVTGNVQSNADIYPIGAGRGLFTRTIDRLGTVTDHFRSGSLPAGFTWQGSPFDGTPSALQYSGSSDYLMAYANTSGGRIFMSKAITNAAASWQGKRIYARIKASLSSEAGVRVDDGTDSNYFEVFLTGLGNATQRLDCRRCVGGVVDPLISSGLIIPVDTYIVVLLLCYWNGSQYQFLGYIVGEDGSAVNISGFGSGIVTWCPAAGRVGLLGKQNNGGYGFWDWFWTDFT